MSKLDRDVRFLCFAHFFFAGSFLFSLKNFALAGPSSDAAHLG
jgi:hypothetical protein